MKDNFSEDNSGPRLGYITIKVTHLERFVTWIIAIFTVIFSYPQKEYKEMAILRPGDEGYDDGLSCRQVGEDGEKTFWEV